VRYVYVGDLERAYYAAGGLIFLGCAALFGWSRRSSNGGAPGPHDRWPVAPIRRPILPLSVR
ncbi:MAG: hypothetical protein ACRDJN_11195, partial [Chloroflexota bacterium]